MSQSEPSRHRSPAAPGTARTILHVDLDAFFAAVEARDDPRLLGRPVVVGADPLGGRGRGVVAAASYEARTFGIHSAMPISEAYRRCPSAIFVRPRFAEYAATSKRFMAILGRFSDTVEPISIDEAFVDVTASARLFGDGQGIAEQIRAAVRREEGLSASIGVAPVKFVAKIASDLRKPDGLVVVEPGQVQTFLEEIGIERLWGAGPRAVQRFHALGVFTIGEVGRVPPSALETAFGARAAAHFVALAQGRDDREVVPHRARKSIGKETTFLDNEPDRAKVTTTLLNLLEAVTRRLRHSGLKGGIVSVKLRTAEFRTVNRQATLRTPADTVEEIWPVARQLLSSADDSASAIRLVGIAVSGLLPGESGRAGSQMSLFTPAADSARSRRLAEALDAVAERFGESAVQRGIAKRARSRRVDTDEHE